MRSIIKALLVLSVTVVFGVSFSYAQTAGTRVGAEIPFDFAIGNKLFPAGNYTLSVTRQNGSVYSVQLRDGNGELICNTVAIQNGSNTQDRSEMVFAVTADRRQLEKLSSPEFGYIFIRSRSDKHLAVAGRVSVPASTVGPN